MSGKTMVLLQSEVPKSYSNIDGIIQIIGLLFVLIVILIAAYFATKVLGKLSAGQLKNSNFKVIDTYRISPNKFIQIIKIGNKFVAVAVAKDTISVITEIDESEIIVKDVFAKENINFKQILEKLRNKAQ